MKVKVSVIIPTFKRSDYLRNAIESILNQTYENVEAIVVDDNPPDSKYRTNTMKTMERFTGNNKVKYIKNKKNLGGALARNEGIFGANGDYITFLDDDDTYLNEKVETQIEYMLNKELDLSFMDVRIHNKNNVLVDYREHDYVKSLAKEELLKSHIMHHLTPTSTYMFKKEAITKIGGFDHIEVGQEFMLMLKAIESNLRIGYIPKALVVQFLHDSERISVGQNKIDKELELFNFKKKYFKKLSYKQKKYVVFRHNAVMVVVGIRSKKYWISSRHFIKAVYTSPLNCLREIINHLRRIRKYKKY
ncbi:glycosyltransferase family 2 protein [Planococcus sp. X10-3]|uniref:glycosyltransferase family 2 protein n=1 Tax=Planococcus sp. X10-3 TaxID=3061240 RepID=UPI003BB09734